MYDVHMPYHHGNLSEALVEASFQTAREHGPDAVVLRAATRAVGVSPNAAYRHFADRDQLLQAVAARCLERLAQLMQVRLLEVPDEADAAKRSWSRLKAAGSAYIEFAVSEPGWFRTAFGSRHPTEPAALIDDGNPFSILKRLLDELVNVGALSAERRVDAEYAAWAAVHGVATLSVDELLAALSDEERTRVVNKVLDVVIAGL